MVGVDSLGSSEVKLTLPRHDRDRRKLTFYFVAEKRIDFRELVRELFRFVALRHLLQVAFADVCLAADSTRHGSGWRRFNDVRENLSGGCRRILMCICGEATRKMNVSLAERRTLETRSDAARKHASTRTAAAILARVAVLES